MRTAACIFIIAICVLKNIADKPFKIFTNKNGLLFSLLFPTIISSTQAQRGQLRFKHYTTTDGLSQGDVYHMTQDSRGFMWFGTFDGLNRFDGYNFKVFKPEYNDSNSIEGGRINSIIEDKNGMLWIGTNEALNCYDFRTEHVKHFYALDSLHKNLKTGYNPFFIDDKNELWFVYNSELGFINLLTGKITNCAFTDGVMDEFTTADYPQHQFYRHLSKIYSAGYDGLHIIDLDKKQTEFYFSLNPHNKSGKNILIKQVLEDENHILWLASAKGLISFSPQTMQTKLYNKYNEKKVAELSCLVKNTDNNIWCGNFPEFIE